MLSGKVAIVTGGGRGIGRATAQLLCEHGARVLVNDLDAGPLEETRNLLGSNCAVLRGDLTQAGAPEALVEKAIELWGAVDIVINNAGYAVSSKLENMTDDVWRRMLDIHATVPFQIIRAAAPHLLAAAKQDRAAGREVFRKIVNVSSSAIMGTAGMANYSAGKSAVVGLTKSLAKEWGEHRINVNAVGFGVIDTRLTQPRDPGNMLEIEGERVQLGLPAKLNEGVTAGIPFGRMGTPREAAGGVFLLCTPWSNWINGQMLMVTGGQVFGMSS